MASFEKSGKKKNKMNKMRKKWNEMSGELKIQIAVREKVLSREK